MQRIARWFSRRNEKGSTMIEALVALVILSVLGIGAWHAVSVSMRLAARLQRSLTAGAQLLHLDDTLRECAGRIIPPWWAPEQLAKVTATSLTVPYLDGDDMKALALSFEDGVFEISNGASVFRFTDFRGVIFSTAAKGSAEYGIYLQFEKKDGRKIAITACFGGTSIRKAAGQLAVPGSRPARRRSPRFLLSS